MGSQCVSLAETCVFIFVIVFIFILVVELARSGFGVVPGSVFVALSIVIGALVALALCSIVICLIVVY